MVPLLRTGTEIELRKLLLNLLPRETFVAERIMCFAELGPYLDGDFEGGGGEEGGEGVQGCLEGAGHGGDEDEVWGVVSGEGDLARGGVADGGEGCVGIRVGGWVREVVDVVGGLAVPDYVNLGGLQSGHNGLWWSAG